ncbi:hypothetical protein ABZ801_12145 [Actinomadura sp. NPDC047616]|uniref:hypothetical protein n=1 Tax=Actinomadura sp. NPDC047616 TaxID=3155914 RepID=UPI0033CA330D
MAEFSASAGHRAFVVAYLKTEPAQAPFTLLPVAALSEVISVCETVRAGHQPPQPHDRRTLTNDVIQALKSLGPNLSRILEPDLQDYLQALKDLPKDLEDGGASLRLLHTTRLLRQRLRRSECAQAAWRDLVEAVCVSGPELDRDRLHVLQVREIDEALGNQWSWRRSHLRSKVQQAGFDQAEQLLSIADHPVRVAWFAFANAGLADDYLRVGQIQFFSRRLWDDLAEHPEILTRWREAQFPAELTPPIRRLMSVDDDPADADPAHRSDDADTPTGHAAGHYVYARVELEGPRAQGRYNPQAHGRAPAEWARDLVLSVVEAATFRRGGSAWRLMLGETIYHDPADSPTASTSSNTSDNGRSVVQDPAPAVHADPEPDPEANWSYALPFDDPARDDAVTPYEVLQEGTGRALESLPGGYAAALARGEPAALDAAAEVRWYQATRRQVDPAQRVVLYVRAFEQSLPLRGSERWDRTVDYFLRQRWALAQFLRDLRVTASRCDWLMARLQSAEHPAYEAFGPRTRHDRRPLDMPAFLHSAAAVAAAIPKDWPLERYQAKAVDRWARDPLATRQHLQKLEQRFGLLLVRALRLRNAVVHGTRTVPAVVATVDSFLNSLSAFIVDDAINGVVTGQDLSEVLEHRRARARRALWRLEQDGADTTEILYGSR